MLSVLKILRDRFKPAFQVAVSACWRGAQAVGDGGIWFKRFQRAQRLGNAAAARGAEWCDGFAGEIVRITEGADDHRRVAPPDRIAEIDRVVAGEIQRFPSDGWAGVWIVLLLIGAAAVVVVVEIGVGVRFFRLDLKEVCATCSVLPVAEK